MGSILIRDDWHSHGQFEDSIQVCRMGPLVYIRTLKCASSFFYNNFCEHLRWEPMHFKDINWAHHHVFSHIMDPVERRHKGVLEWILMSDAQDLLRNSADFRRVIGKVAMLEDHSQSYHDRYGHCCWMIDWIPTSLGYDTTIGLTERLLWKYNIRVMGRWNKEHMHLGGPEQQELCDILRRVWNADGALPRATHHYMARDMVLYQRVMKLIDPAGEDWDHTSWLRQRQQMPLYDAKYWEEETKQ